MNSVLCSGESFHRWEAGTPSGHQSTQQWCLLMEVALFNQSILSHSWKEFYKINASSQAQIYKKAILFHDLHSFAFKIKKLSLYSL